MTEKLYDKDPMLREFTARVISCAEEKGRFAVALDRTAFFPEGGGQGGDVGFLGDVAVADTHERDGRIVHFCDRPLPVGAEVTGRLDWTVRFARMQIHSAEHIVSGTAHRLWGCENVGFHMTEHSAVLDFDREIAPAQLTELENIANEAVWDDLPVRILCPDPGELARMQFRQKKELTGKIRLVEIPGVDLCACCAPHVDRTGRIGAILLTDMMRHRGGVRITMTAGRSALGETAALRQSAGTLSRLLSAPRDALAAGLERLLDRQEAQKEAMAGLERRYTALLAEQAAARGDDILCFVPGELSAAAMRGLGSALAAKCPGVAGVLVPEGTDVWRYVLSSRTVDLRSRVKALNAALNGRGGGQKEMVQGTFAASRAAVEEAFYGKEP